jgi:DNA-directed RNA polymerase alpha subunit
MKFQDFAEYTVFGELCEENQAACENDVHSRLIQFVFRLSLSKRCENCEKANHGFHNIHSNHITLRRSTIRLRLVQTRFFQILLTN